MAELFDPGAGIRRMYLESMGGGKEETSSLSKSYKAMEELKLQREREARFGAAEQARETAEKARAAAEAERIQLEKNKNDFEQAIKLHQEGRLTDKTMQDIITGKAHAAEAITAAKKNVAETGKIGVETTNALAEGERKKAENILNVAHGRINTLVAPVLAGTPLTPAQADDLEKQLRIVGGNNSLQLPRNPDGTLKMTPQQMAGFIVNPKTGMPDADYAIQIRRMFEAHGSFGKDLQDLDDMIQRGADPRDIEMARGNLEKRILLPVDSQIASYVHQYATATGDMRGAMELSGQLKNLSTAKTWDGQSKLNWESGRKLEGDLQGIITDYDNLLKAGRLPRGVLARKWADWKGSNDSDVTNLSQRMNAFAQNYVLHEMVKGGTPAEKDARMKEISGIFSDPEQWHSQMGNMLNDLELDNAMTAGIAKNNGEAVPDSVPTVDPNEVIKNGGTFHNVLDGAGNIVDGDSIRNHYLGLQNVSRAAHQKETGIGTVTSEARDKGDQTPSTTETPTTSSTSTTLQSVPDFHPGDYKNPIESKKAHDRLRELDQLLQDNP